MESYVVGPIRGYTKRNVVHLTGNNSSITSQSKMKSFKQLKDELRNPFHKAKPLLQQRLTFRDRSKSV